MFDAYDAAPCPLDELGQRELSHIFCPSLEVTFSTFVYQSRRPAEQGSERASVCLANCRECAASATAASVSDSRRYVSSSANFERARDKRLFMVPIPTLQISAASS